MKILVLLLAAALIGAVGKYPTMAPVRHYLIASRNVEIALARSAAPSAISDHASVLVLGPRGYEIAVKGTNGFVCLVERSWFAGFGDPGFWNPKTRGPDCYTPTAARTELPNLLKRTQWALRGMSLREIAAETHAAFANHSFTQPAPGAMTYMLSKRGYLGDAAAGPWLPHVMFFVPSAQAKAWGADLRGSPAIDAGLVGDKLGPTLVLVPVRRWSDGTFAPAPKTRP